MLSFLENVGRSVMKNNAFKILSFALVLISNNSVFAAEQMDVIAARGGGARIERAEDVDVDVNRQREREMGEDTSVETVTTPGSSGTQTTVIQSGTGPTTGAGMVVPTGEDLNRARDSGDFNGGAREGRDFRGR